MQVSRMFEMLYILLENERVSAASLAKRLEVSVRTVYRDAQALCQAGIPIYAERGRNGCICILPTCKLSRTLLSEEDRKSILASLRAMQQSGAQEGDTLRRMTAFLGADEPDWVEIDLSDWSGQQGALLATLKAAILGRQIIEFTYYGESGRQTLRRVCPTKLWFKGKTWYLRAYCLLRREARTFKLTRIKRAQIVPGDFPPESFACEPAAMREDSSPPMVSMQLIIDRRMAFRVWDDFDESQITVLDDGRFLVEATFPAGPWVNGMILSYGEYAQVIAPEALRQEIAASLQNMLALYQS